MHNKKRILTACMLLTCILATGCGEKNTVANHVNSVSDTDNQTFTGSEMHDNRITLSSDIRKLGNGLSAVKFEGNDKFEEFLSSGGASSDADVIAFLSSNLLADVDNQCK